MSKKNKKTDSAELPRTFVPKKVERIVEEQSFMEILTFGEVWSEEERKKLIDFIPEGDNIFVFQTDDMEDMWIHERLLQMNSNANDHVFTFNIDHMAGCMVVAYEEGDNMPLMSGIGPGVTGNRKITTYTPLNDDYEGGSFHITTAPLDTEYKLGCSALFPTFMPIEIAPVTKGTKYVLWSWVGGTTRFK